MVFVIDLTDDNIPVFFPHFVDELDEEPIQVGLQAFLELVLHDLHNQGKYSYRESTSRSHRPSIIG